MANGDVSMKELVSYIAKALVDDLEHVEISEIEGQSNEYYRT